MNWKALLFEVFEDQRPTEKAVHVDNFTFEAGSVDSARSAAIAWLEKRGLISAAKRRSLRSFSHLAKDATGRAVVNTVAIVLAKPREAP